MTSNLSMTPTQRKILFFSCLILVIGLMAMDFINPSLPFIMDELQISQSTTKGLMVVYMIALSFAQFFYGTYSDTYGRKQAIILSILIAISGFIICALSTTIFMLYVGRFLTALGTAGCPVISRALISDVFADKVQLKQAFSYFSMSSQFSPAIAPVIGGVIQHYAGWHWSFLALALLNIVAIMIIFFFMPESHQNKGLKKSIKKQFTLYTQYIKKTHFMIFSTQSALIFVYTIGFYSLSPFVFHILGYTAIQNGFFYAIYAAGIVLGAWFLATWLKDLNAEKTFKAAIILYPILFIISAIIFSFSQIGALIAAFSFLLGFMCGIAAPLTLFLCMDGFTEDKGAASAMQSFVKMFFTGVALLACNFFQLSNFVVLVFIFLGVSIVMAGLFYFEKKL